MGNLQDIEYEMSHIDAIATAGRTNAEAARQGAEQALAARKGAEVAYDRVRVAADRATYHGEIEPVRILNDAQQARDFAAAARAAAIAAGGSLQRAARAKDEALQLAKIATDIAQTFSAGGDETQARHWCRYAGQAVRAERSISAINPYKHTDAARTASAVTESIAWLAEDDAMAIIATNDDRNRLGRLVAALEISA